MSIAKISSSTSRILLDIFIIAISAALLRLSWVFLNALELTQGPLSGKDITGLAFVCMFAFAWVPLTWLVMYHATPKVLVERYLKEPHFTVAEIVGRSIVSPLIPFPTTLFMVACTLPRRWLESRWLYKRQMADLRDHAPRWFIWSSRVVWVSAATHALLWIGLMVGLGVYTTVFSS